MIVESYITYHRPGINSIRERFQKEIEEILRMEDTKELSSFQGVFADG
jgi:hypothetical protein